MAERALITAERLREVLNYDPETGALRDAGFDKGSLKMSLKIIPAAILVAVMATPAHAGADDPKSLARTLLKSEIETAASYVQNKTLAHDAVQDAAIWFFIGLCRGKLQNPNPAFAATQNVQRAEPSG